jgi:hypothetical protein
MTDLEKQVWAAAFAARLSALRSGYKTQHTSFATCVTQAGQWATSTVAELRSQLGKKSPMVVFKEEKSR